MRQLKYLLVFFIIVLLVFSAFANSHKDESNPATKHKVVAGGDQDTLRVTLGAVAGLKLVATTGEIAGLDRAWGVAFSPDGNYVYVPAKGQTAPVVWIIMISDPANPLVVGSFEIPNSENLTPEAWGVKVRGNHLYVAAYGCGLQIYDITNPIHPALVGLHYDDKSESRGLYVSGNHCYVADAWNGLSIYDVTDPATPRRLCQYNTDQDIRNQLIELGKMEENHEKICGYEGRITCRSAYRYGS